jgi:D-glycero-alpha-D-manno-heptose-7-phosphate kinase
VLFFTGFARTASEVAQVQIKETHKRQAELSAMFQMVSEAEAIITSTNRPIRDFGSLLHESWKLKKSLTDRISNPHIDEIYQAGLEAGAIGGKLLGAGGGGFMLFFVTPQGRKALINRLNKLLCVPITFPARGSHVVVYEPEHAYKDPEEVLV